MPEISDLEFEEPISPTELVGETGLVLRESTSADIPQELAFINKHRAEIEELEPSYKKIQTENDLIMPHQNINLRLYNIWLQGEYIGFRTRKKEDDGSVSTGCIVDKDKRGQGYGSDSLLALIAHEFADDSTNRITTFVDDDNTISQAVMDKTGFKKAGEDIDPKRTKQGVPIRRFLYELTREDYLAAQHPEIV
jgi:RimJ/RimL family protein N-acetyltransferase